jgi:DMSO reductase family type II enzyme chaperone
MPNFTEWASEYMRLFELPVDGQPCPLYGGIYASSRREVMEELLRYYHFFGLTTHGADQGDLPDSIPTLLEFMQFLALRESVSGDVATARNAQKDLLERHLTRWIPAIITPLRERKPLVFYSDVLNLLNRFVSLELQALATESAPSRSAGVASGT